MRDADAPTPVEDAPKDRPEGLGPALRAARKSRGISLEQISERLRIEPRSLVALEEERFEALGAPVFVKGYLKLYSDYLGLDTARLLAVYRAEHGSDEPAVQARRSVEREEQRSAGVWFAATAAVVLVAAVLWLLREPMENATEEPVTTAVDAGMLAEPESNVPAAAPVEFLPTTNRTMPAGLDSDAATRLPVAGSTAAPAASDGTAAPGASEAEDAGFEVGPSDTEADAAGSDASGVNAAGIAAGIDIRTVSSQGGSIAPAIPPAAADELAIEMRFIEDSWAEIVDARDARLFYGLGRAGGGARFNAASPVSVLLGNADGVVLEVDGETFPYPENSRRGRLVRFTLSTPAE